MDTKVPVIEVRGLPNYILLNINCNQSRIKLLENKILGTISKKYIIEYIKQNKNISNYSIRSHNCELKYKLHLNNFTKSILYGILCDVKNIEYDIKYIYNTFSYMEVV